MIDARFITHSGLVYYYDAPAPDMICIEDVAHALSNLCRFAGHTKTFYSVAEHCVRVSYMCPKGLELEGLLHDASEAYCVDLPSPLKHQPDMLMYREYEKAADRVIRRRFGLCATEPVVVKRMDTEILRAEQRDLVGGYPEPVPYPTIKPWTPVTAKVRFLKRYAALTKGVQ